MKSVKLFTTGLFALFAVGVANAQQEADNTADDAISFGVKGGVNFATVTGGEDGFDPDSRTSFHVGVVGEFPLDDMISIQAEALYSGQGFEISDSEVSDDKVEYQLDYLNIPILAKVYLFEGFSLEAGPQFSFKVNEEIDSDPNNDDGDTNVEIAEDFDIGVSAGVTFLTDMGLFASGRYNLGFQDVVEDSNLQNSVFQISLGYKF
ncbi:MAG TPA: porin family protein [Flavobacterium sp.]|jgi:hypothetical protein